MLNEAVLCKTCFGMALKVSDIEVQPDGAGEIQFIACLIQCLKYLMGTGILLIVADHHVFE